MQEKKRSPRKKVHPSAEFPSPEDGAFLLAQKTDANILSYLHTAGVNNRNVEPLPHGAFCYFQYPKNLPVEETLPCLRPALKDILTFVEREVPFLKVDYGIRRPDNDKLPFRKRWNKGWLSVQVCQPYKGGVIFTPPVVDLLPPPPLIAAQVSVPPPVPVEKRQQQPLEEKVESHPLLPRKRWAKGWLDQDKEWLKRMQEEKISVPSPVEKPQQQPVPEDVPSQEDEIRAKVWAMRQPVLRARLKGFGLSGRGLIGELKKRLFEAMVAEKNNPQPEPPKRKRLFRAKDFVSEEAEEAGSDETFSEEEEI